MPFWNQKLEMSSLFPILASVTMGVWFFWRLSSIREIQDLNMIQKTKDRLVCEALIIFLLMFLGFLGISSIQKNFL